MIGILEPQRDDIVQALMGSLPIVMMFNLAEHMAKMLFSQQNQVIQRLPCFTHEPLGIRIAHRGLRRRLDDLDSRRTQDLVQWAESAVSVVDQIRWLR